MSTEELELLWKRPADVPFPNVWHRFEINWKGERLPARIQDVTPDRYDDVWNLYEKHFYPDEPLLRSAGTHEDKETMASQKWLLHQLMNQKMCLMAVLDNNELTPTVIGGQIIYVYSKNDRPFPVLPGAARRRFVDYFGKLHRNIDFFQILDTDKCLKDNGLVVKREFRRLNVASHLLVALEKMAKTFGIRAAVITFNNTQSQRLAEKAGFKVLNELSFIDYVDQDGQMLLPVDNQKSAKCMYIKYL